MTFTEAAREVLEQCGHPLHYKEITEIAIEKNLLSHVGKSPEVTMGARLAATLKKGGDETPLIRVKPGVFALRDWDEETIKKGLEIKRSAPRRKKKESDDEPEGSNEGDASASPKRRSRRRRKDRDEEDDKADASDDDVGASEAPAVVVEEVFVDESDVAPAEPNRAELDGAELDGGERDGAAVTAAATDPKAAAPGDDDDDHEGASEDAPRRRPRARRGRRRDDDVDPEPQTPDEAKRAEIAAAGSEIFAEEDDDDQPILRAQDDEGGDGQGEEGGRRRRRRRRRRGSRKSDPGGLEGGQLPAYTAKPVDGDEPHPPRGPQVIEVSRQNLPAFDGLAGTDLADAIALTLESFDRTVGAVSLRQIAETAQRHGKLDGDLQLAQSHIAAAVRADNARRRSRGQRPRFRTAGGRIGLTDWVLDGDLARYEREVMQALGRYRQAAQKAIARKCAELPGHAFVELVFMVLERVGAKGLQAVKFPGASGAEVHLAGTLYAPAATTSGRVGYGTGLPLAVVIRKDGRDVGRERVTELRGSAHHYGDAKMGWIVTAGQALSGAKEECGSEGGVMPVTLLDGYGLAQLCADYGVGVLRAEHPVSVPDVDLFEALRSS